MSGMGMGSAIHSQQPGCAPGECNMHGRKIQKPAGYVPLGEWTVGSCDLQKIHHLKLTRELLLEAKAPLIVIGLTDNWTAHHAWGKEELLRKHGEEPYHLHKHGNATLNELLLVQFKYHMGHAVYPPSGCYSDPWRPYSPMLFDALVDDYRVPPYLTPMATFQAKLAGSARAPIRYGREEEARLTTVLVHSGIEIVRKAHA